MGACSSKSKGVTPGAGPSAASLSGGLTILTIGLDNSGKSTMLGALTTWMTPDGRLKTRENGPPASEVDPFVVPTVGFSSPVSCPLINGAKVTFYDIGGGARIRGVWPQYFADVHGVVYVVDSADRQRVEESAEEMKKALLHPRLVGKPLLILANKQDLPSALSSPDLSSLLSSPHLSPLSRHHLQPCIAKPSCNGGVFDDRILAGLQWLVEAIRSDFHNLALRRGEEMKAQEKEEAERKAEAKKAQEKPAADANAAPVCVLCKAHPAVRRSAAAGWQAVCEPCGKTAEDKKAEEKKKEEEAERALLAAEDAAAAKKENNTASAQTSSTPAAAGTLATASKELPAGVMNSGAGAEPVNGNASRTSSDPRNTANGSSAPVIVTPSAATTGATAAAAGQKKQQPAGGSPKPACGVCKKEPATTSFTKEGAPTAACAPCADNHAAGEKLRAQALSSLMTATGDCQQCQKSPAATKIATAPGAFKMFCQPCADDAINERALAMEAADRAGVPLRVSSNPTAGNSDEDMTRRSSDNSFRLPTIGKAPARNVPAAVEEDDEVPEVNYD